MRRIHQDVVSVDAVKEVRKNYKKYLAESEPSKAGLFSELERKKIMMPSIQLSNDSAFDPLMNKLKTERSIYK